MKRPRRALRIIVFLAVVLSTLPSVPATPAWAGVPNPSTWQTTATGLKTTATASLAMPMEQNSTSGLGFVVNNCVASTTCQLTAGWPDIWMPGGVQYTGYTTSVVGPVGIELGEIQVPGEASPSLSSESADWSYDQLVYNNGTQYQLTLTASRMSPGLLVQYAGAANSKLDLFRGNVFTFTDTDTSGLDTLYQAAKQKYVAYVNGGTEYVQALSGTAFNLPSLDNHWLLVWYGTNSPFDDTQVPESWPFPTKVGCCQLETTSVAYANAYQADAPIMLLFNGDPTAIAQGASGGIELTFGNGTTSTELIPPDGFSHPAASTTNGWSAAIPSSLLTSVNFWASHACSFPTDVAETYADNSSTDTVTTTESFTFQTVCAAGAGTTYATLPPILGVDAAALGVSFSGTLVNSGMATIFGPITGIENTSSYTWSISGLGKYVDFQRPVGSGAGNVPQWLTQAIAAQVSALNTAGHLAPWIWWGKPTYEPQAQGLWFDNPSDTVGLLARVLEGLPPGSTATTLSTYLASERTNYPPETTYSLPLESGAARGDWQYPQQTVNSQNVDTYMRAQRPDLFETRVPLYNFYALAEYYQAEGGTPSAAVITAGQTALNNDFAEQDWATMYDFYGYGDKKTSIENANREVDGLIGLAKLSELEGDTATMHLCRELLAKAIALRVGLTQYVPWLYTAGLVTLPGASNWFTSESVQIWWGTVPNNSWTSSADDHRVPVVTDQFQVVLHTDGALMTADTGTSQYESGLTWAYLPEFMDLTPQLGMILHDFAKAQTDVELTKFTSVQPNWYESFAETMEGAEHGFNYPVDSYDVYLAMAWVDLDPAPTLQAALDVTQLDQVGDLFYLEKLEELQRADESRFGYGTSLPIQR